VLLVEVFRAGLAFERTGVFGDYGLVVVAVGSTVLEVAGRLFSQRRYHALFQVGGRGGLADVLSHWRLGIGIAVLLQVVGYALDVSVHLLAHCEVLVLVHNHHV